MKTNRFQTDQRLWIWISLALFVACWCFVRIGGKGPGPVAAVALWEWIVRAFRADASARDILGFGMMLLMFGCIAALAALILAWFLHCAVVIARTKVRG